MPSSGLTADALIRTADLPAAGVEMIPIADAEATWDFLVVWQRGPTAGPLQVLIEALSASMNDACAEQRRATLGKNGEPLSGSRTKSCEYVCSVIADGCGCFT